MELNSEQEGQSRIEIFKENINDLAKEKSVKVSYISLDSLSLEEKERRCRIFLEWLKQADEEHLSKALDKKEALFVVNIDHIKFEESETVETIISDKTGIFRGINVDFGEYDKDTSTEEYDWKIEAISALDDLNEEEIKVLKDGDFKIVLKKEVPEGGNLVPFYREEKNTIEFPFFATGDEILSCIRSTVIPHLNSKSQTPKVEIVDLGIINIGGEEYRINNQVRLKDNDGKREFQDVYLITKIQRLLPANIVYITCVNTDEFGQKRQLSFSEEGFLKALVKEEYSESEPDKTEAQVQAQEAYDKIMEDFPGIVLSKSEKSEVTYREVKEYLGGLTEDKVAKIKEAASNIRISLTGTDSGLPSYFDSKDGTFNLHIKREQDIERIFSEFFEKLNSETSADRTVEPGQDDPRSQDVLVSGPEVHKSMTPQEEPPSDLVEPEQPEQPIESAAVEGRLVTSEEIEDGSDVEKEKYLKRPWRDTQEWQDFEKARLDRAEREHAAIRDKKIFGDLDGFEYFERRKKIQGLIESELKSVLNYYISDEKGKLVADREIRRQIFEELVVAEDQAYKKALDQHRYEEGKFSWALNKAKTVLNTDLFKWYLGLNKPKRFAVNMGLFAVAVGVGTFAGALAPSAAVGAVTYRGARMLGSLAGVEVGRRVGKRGVNIGNKQLISSQEQIDSYEREEKEKIEISDDDVAQKAERYKELQEDIKKKRRKLGIYKAGLTVGLGAGAGMATGFGINHYDDISDFIHNKVGRGSFHPGSDVRNEGQSLPVGRNVGPDNSGPNTQTTPTSALDSKPEPKTESAPESSKLIFGDIEKVEVVARAGDSHWSMIGKILEGYDKYKNMSGGDGSDATQVLEAKRTHVIALLNNDLQKNLDKYGVEGDLKVGDKVDYSKLFADKGRVDKAIESAERLRPQQINTIVTNNAKIEDWVKNNPDRILDEEIVQEILSPESEIIVSSEEPELSHNISEDEHIDPEVEDTTHNFDYILRPEERDTSYYQTSGLSDVSVKLEKIRKIYNEDPDDASIVAELKKLETEGEELANKIKSASFHNIKEVNDKKDIFDKKFEDLVKQANDAIHGDEYVNYAENLRSIARDSAGYKAVEEEFNRGIDHIYGKRRLLFWHTNGLNTKEAEFIMSKDFNEILEYAKGNKNQSGLSEEDIKTISGSKKHRAFIEVLKGDYEEAIDLGIAMAFRPGTKVREGMKSLVEAVMKVRSLKR